MFWARCPWNLTIACRIAVAIVHWNQGIVGKSMGGAPWFRVKQYCAIVVHLVIIPTGLRVVWLRGVGWV